MGQPKPAPKFITIKMYRVYAAFTPSRIGHDLIGMFVYDIHDPYPYCHSSASIPLSSYPTLGCSCCPMVVSPTSSTPIPMAMEAFKAGRVAVVTGASSGIGLALAKRCASLGMKVRRRIIFDQPWHISSFCVSPLKKSILGAF